ncbi:DUF4384 domain-containing protein [bacterium]|nr:DUF4384 domain-containing protein [bacterium]
MKTTRQITATVALALAGTVLSGCGLNPKSKLKDEDFIPMRYPQSAMSVGAVGWGKPTGPITAFRPGPDNLSEDFLEKMPTADVAFADKIKSNKVYVDLVANPGPEILSALNVGGAKVDTGFEKESLKFLEWGELQERSVDMQRLSDAVVRGWYNMPGEAFRLDALVAIRPDKVKYENRPWLVQRSLTTVGMKYGSEQKLSADLGVGAKDPIYGKAEIETGFSTTSGSTLKVKRPMVIGYNTAELVSVEPPLPPIGLDANSSQMSTHTFTWKVRGHTGKTSISVDPTILKALAKRNGIEEVLPEPVVDSVTEEVKKGEPIKVSMIGEVIPKSGGDWRLRGEGSTVTGGELLRLRINLNEPGYVYLLNKDSNGEAVVLYPKVDGQPLSRGQDTQLEAGEFYFPTSVIGVDGMTLSEDAEGGTESFLLVASKTQLPGLPAAMADFALACDKAAAANPSATRNATLGLTDIPRTADMDSVVTTRKVTGYANAEAVAEDLPTEEEISFPAFTGVGAATVMTLNLKKAPSQ